MTYSITLQNDTSGCRLKIERGGFTCHTHRGSDTLCIWEQVGTSTHAEDGRRLDLSSVDIEDIAESMETAGMWHRVGNELPSEITKKEIIA